MKNFWGFYQNLGPIEHPFGLFDLGHLAYLAVTVLVICLCFRQYKKCGAAGKRKWQRVFAVYFVVQELFFYTWTGLSCRENAFFEVLQLEMCTFCLFFNFSTLFHDNKQVRFFGALIGLIGGPIAMIYPATMVGVYPVFCYRLINFYMTHGSYVFFSLMLLHDRELMDRKRLPRQLAIAGGLLAAVYCFNLKFHTQYMFVGTPPEIGFIRAIYDVVGDLLFLPTAIVIFSLAQVLMYFVVLKLQKFAYREQYVDEKDPVCMLR